ncbi:hypothetical protein R9C00_17695 [Flammeovirgaceae bacterium SG7u.111]|nr:hypothetical protein [Flammeovirgaceae bacterium SG7u.132]WPO33537.1 hypothetical protein R9C00_17695 [Flammeovirgaceae bacterium SG7u.111]
MDPERTLRKLLNEKAITSTWKKARGVKDEIRDLQTMLYVNSRCMHDENH